MGSVARKLSAYFNTASSKPGANFEYGWCKTDHKDGKEIRGSFRDHDYMNEEPYASSVRSMLAKLGLPQPKPEEIFRGTHHDLLFLNSHGVVVRIGPTDVQDLINPAIVQPLGWIEDRSITITNKDPWGDGTTPDIPLSVAIYPGIELSRDYHKKTTSEQKPKRVEKDLLSFLGETGQGTDDAGSYENQGVIRVLDDNGSEIAVPVLLDADNDFNKSSPALAARRFEQMHKLGQFIGNKGDILSQTIDDVFVANDIKYWKRAFEVHQPLRLLFWEAFKEGQSDNQPNAEALSIFWDACANVTNKPQSTVMPVWKANVDENGNASFERQEVIVPQVVLYRPWTGQQEDKKIDAISFDEKTKKSVANAYRNMKMRNATMDSDMDLAAVFVDTKTVSSLENPELRPGNFALRAINRLTRVLGL